MKCQVLFFFFFFFLKIRKTVSKCLLKFLPSMLSVNIQLKFSVEASMLSGNNLYNILILFSENRALHFI